MNHGPLEIALPIDRFLFIRDIDHQLKTCDNVRISWKVKIGRALIIFLARFKNSYAFYLKNRKLKIQSDPSVNIIDFNRANFHLQRNLDFSNSRSFERNLSIIQTISRFSPIRRKL